MGNNLTRLSGFAALSPQQQQEHRLKIGARAEAILGQFWRDNEADAVRAIEIEGWMDVLENCSHSEIRAAWAAYQKTGPRTAAGKLYRPDAGALYHIILAARPKPKLVVDEARPATREENAAIAAELERKRATNPERAAEAQAILKEFGYSKKMGGNYDFYSRQSRTGSARTDG